MSNDDNSSPDLTPPATSRGGALFLVKALISTSILLFLANRIEWQDLWQATLSVRLEYFLASYSCLFALEALVAWRLRILMRPMDFQLPLLRLLKISLISRFLGFFLPAGLGQGVVRWFKVTRARVGRLQFLVVTTIEKALLFVTTLLCVGLPLVLSPDPRVQHIRAALLPIVIIGLPILGGLLLTFFYEPAYRQIRRGLSPLGERLGRPSPRLSALLGEVTVFFGRTADLLSAASITVGVQAMVLLRIALLFYAVGLDLPWLTVLWAGSLVFVIQALPISIAGLGVREYAFAYVVGILDRPPELGMLVGLLFFAQIVITALIGGLLEVFDRGHEFHPEERQP
jgi:uncharacterized membrane protein YbhN (UPF0104 family)